MLAKYSIQTKIKILVILFLIIVTTSVISFSLSAKLDNDVEIEFNSELIYYLDVTYDGVDKYGVESSDSTKANITSDYIYVEDKLPEGLIFNGFVTTSDNTFGAVSRDDTNSVCHGSVIDDGQSSNDYRSFTWYYLDEWEAIEILQYQTDWSEFLTADKYNQSLPTKEGGIFKGWSEPILDSDLNVSYYAIFENDLDFYEEIGIDPPNVTLPESQGGSYHYHGLHYDETTRTVSFKVRNLQAGCKLTIGIKTITPSSVDDPATEETELRRDFYNFSTAKEGENTKVSNTVHAWMGTDKVSLYNVKYEYTGDIPNNAPTLPSQNSYSSGTKVGVSLIPIAEGYHFTGWETEDVSVSNNIFIMPSNNVTFKGSFEKKDNYKVTYEIEGALPDGYIIPSEKTHYPDSFVKLDSLKKGDVFNGYRFLGWESNDVIINNDQTFIMPEKDVVIRGSFEPVTYKVEYRFYDTVLPPNSDSLLPETREYRPGGNVTLDNPSETEGYKFLGWYKESNFTMPNHDVIIYGEWKIQNGTFTPSIKKEIVNEQEYYRTGDIVYYKITVTNNADYPIKNVVIKEKNNRAFFYQDFSNCIGNMLIQCISLYNIRTPQIVEIESIDSHTSIEVLAKYIVEDDDQGTINNEVEITSALADNYYELDTTKEYKDSASFKVQSHLQICKEINSNDPKTFQFHITDNENYDSWINLSNNECTTIYLKPNTYNISEIVPQEYVLKEITLTNYSKTETISNGESISIEDNQNYEIKFKNTYKKKGFYHSDGRITNKVSNEKKRIFIYVDNYEKEYDGLLFNDFTYSIEGLENEEILEINFEENLYKNVGTYNIEPIITWKNTEDEYKYDVKIFSGTLIINPRNIIIRSGNASMEYNGNSLTNNTCEILSGEILSTDTYSCNVTGSQINVGTSKNYFNIEFEDSNLTKNYNITKIYGDLTITPIIPKYTIIYTDGIGEKVFQNQITYGLKAGEQTPLFFGSTYREGYTFMGWAPTINPVVSEDDANANNEIIYYATYQKII